jgi:hypothetical protein
MKAQIFYWANGFDLAKKTGYEHKEEIPFEDIFKIQAFIFGMGLNTMLYHHKTGHNGDITLFVDDKRFQQR